MTFRLKMFKTHIFMEHGLICQGRKYSGRDRQSHQTVSAVRHMGSAERRQTAWIVPSLVTQWIPYHSQTSVGKCT